ncbi:MAG: YybH family protein [Candidatus Dormibacteria bacterium]
MGATATVIGQPLAESDIAPEMAELIRFHQANNNLFFNGNPALQNWAHDGELTLHGGFNISGRGWDVLEAGLTMAASRLSEGQMTYNHLGGAVVGDIAYLAGFEEGTVRLDGGERTEMKLRVTTILRRTDGRWVCVHRHGEILR